MKLANTILLWGTLITALLMCPISYAAFISQNDWVAHILLPLAAIIGPLSGFLAVLACIYGLISIIFPKRCKSGLLLPLTSVIIGVAVLLTAFIIPTWKTMKQNAAMEQSLDIPFDEE